MIPSGDILIKQFLEEGVNWLGKAVAPGTQEYVVAAKNATYYRWIANRLIDNNKEPSPAAVKKELAKLQAEEEANKRTKGKMTKKRNNLQVL